MKFLGYRKMEIRNMVLPGNFRKLQQTEAVKLRAKSVEALGLLQAPLVRKSDKQVVFGVRRLAACELAGRHLVEVRLVECSDEELGLLRAAENYDREHNEAAAAAAITDLVDYYTEQIRKEGGFPQPEEKRGRPLTERGEARRRVAAATGKTENAVRQAEHRERQEKKRSEPVPTISIATFGMEMDPDWIAEVAETVKVLEAVYQQLVTAQGAMTGLVKAELGMSPMLLANVRNRIHDAASFLAGELPTSICPYCKGVVEGCATCAGFGVVGKRLVERSDQELLDSHELKVAVEGKIIPIDDYEGGDD